MQVRSGDGIVYFDLADDIYSCSYDPLQPIAPYRELVREANACGLKQVSTIASQCWIDTSPDDHVRPGFMDILRFVTAAIRACLYFHGRSVSDLADMASALGGTNMHSRVTVQHAANVFARLMAFVPFRIECLFGSFFFLHFLDLYGLKARWVFGVQLFPFRAHCWIAHGDALLNDVAHNVESYEIIYVIEQDKP